MSDSFDKYYPRLSSWFADIPKPKVNKLLIRQFEAGELLVIKDRPFQNLYIILEGICSVINQLDNGTEVITLKLTSGDITGASESAFGSIRNIASVKADNRLIVAEMENSMFKDWLKCYPSFTDFVIKISSPVFTILPVSLSTAGPAPLRSISPNICWIDLTWSVPRIRKIIKA